VHNFSYGAGASGSSTGTEQNTIGAAPTDKPFATSLPRRKKRASGKISERTAAKHHNRAKGKLSEVFSLPIEVFVEIIRYLALPDVLALSRASKFFYQMLMTRSAAMLGVWRAAVANVPGLPPCPKDLFTRKKSSQWGMKTCLVRDKEDVEEWIATLQPETDDGSVSEGQKIQIIERAEARMERLKYAMQMGQYLRDMAETRAQEIDQLKDRRRQELRRRMGEAGWEEADWTFPFFVARKWATLVEAPQPLTERAAFSDLVVNMPFPPMVDVLKRPIISDLLEADTDADTMEAKFEESRAEIEASIRSWGSKVQGELVDTLKSGATNSGNPSDSNEGEDHEMRLFAEEPLLELRVQLPPERNNIESLSPDIRLLLRADSVFRVPSDNPGPMPLYFPELFLVMHDRTYGYFGSDSTIFDSINQPKYGNSWKPEEVVYYPEGVAAAKALLNQLGRPNAAQFELQALGPRFTCGSCGDKWVRTWNEMVQHYAEAIAHARMATEAKGSIKKRVKYDSQHRLDLNNQSKGKHKSLIILHSEKEAETLSSNHGRFPLLVGCNLCDQLDIKFQAPRNIMLKHIRTVHSIKAPKAEHYTRTHGYRRHTRIGDRTGFVSDSTEATDPEIVQGVVSNSA
ncbi:hypothetical protein FRC11_012381, partial [Ceratobasidium sp. 423]